MSGGPAREKAGVEPGPGGRPVLLGAAGRGVGNAGGLGPAEASRSWAVGCFCAGVCGSLVPKEKVQRTKANKQMKWG